MPPPFLRYLVRSIPLCKKRGASNYSQGVYFLEKYDGLFKLVDFAQNLGNLQTRMDQSGDHMKMNFDYFQISKMLQTVRVEKEEETNEVISLVFMFPCSVMVVWFLSYGCRLLFKHLCLQPLFF